MLIERILRDTKAVTVTFPPDTAYRFAPDGPHGPFIAKVEYPVHAERLLSIPEGYRAVAEPDPAPQSTDTIRLEAGSIVTPAVAGDGAAYNLTGATVSVADATVSPANAATGAIASDIAMSAEDTAKTLDNAADADAGADAGAAEAAGDGDADTDADAEDGAADADADTVDPDADEPNQADITAPTDLPDFTAMSDDELREQFKTHVGRTPNARAGRATMIAQITAALSGE